ncbi:MAG: CDP-diacylglycerol--serine O-phosphatidyltransferase [Bacteroidales bacterium]|nr:CDP-diacylglycerol--serine O-phosphatidyltransferase [Candidatus Physcousia equi]
MNIKKHIPNTITCCNLICGCLAVFSAVLGETSCALIFIICGAVFDFFDGMVARLLHVSSPIGKELDSLADVVTFGVAPSTMLMTMIAQSQMPAWMPVEVAHYLPFAAFIMAAFSALRLAKFNLDERQSTSFIGLPTPANALFWGALIVGQKFWLASLPSGALWLLVVEFVFCYLLIAELPLFALKFKNLSWKDNWPKFIFLVGCLPCFLLGWTCFAAIIVWYVLLSVVVNKMHK